MIKQHSQRMNLCLGLCDLTIVALAWLASYRIRFAWLPVQKDLPTFGDVVHYLLVALIVSLLVMIGTGLYKPRRDKSFLLEFAEIIKASAIIWVVLIVVFYYSLEVRFTRGMLAIFLPLMCGLMILERGVFRATLRSFRRRGWNLRHALIIGTGRLGQSTLLRIQHNTWMGIRVRGFIDTHPEITRSSVRDVPVIATVDRVKEIVEQEKIDCVFVAIPHFHLSGRQEMVMSQLEQTHVDVRIVPDLFLSRMPTKLTVGELDGLPILSLRENPLAGWPGVYKRVFDILGAAFGLLIFSPLLIPAAILIKLTSAGPIIYRQRRISYGNHEFNIYKFRTMIVSAEHSHGPMFAEPNDPRCTAIGRLLRRFSLDELPQLLNVLKGDMSLVGPRPERPEMLRKIQEEVPTFPLRLKVRAGLTGWAQINGFRGRTSFRKRLQYDLYYLNNWSPMLDLRIVITTFIRGFRHPNAY
jgi:exopolysaccharide biosynthesis polyprenyl glycosylphosphotransferase